MRIKLKEKPSVDIREWHVCYKIFPKLIDGYLIFMEKVERRLVCSRNKHDYVDYHWEYKLIERKEVNEGKS